MDRENAEKMPDRFERLIKPLYHALQNAVALRCAQAVALANTVLLVVLLLTEQLRWLVAPWPWAVTRTLFQAFLATSLVCAVAVGTASVGAAVYLYRRRGSDPRADRVTILRRAVIVPATYLLATLWPCAWLYGHSARAFGGILVGLLAAHQTILIVYYMAQGAREAREERVNRGAGGEEAMPSTPRTPARVRPSPRFALWRRWWELTHPNHFRSLPPLNRALARAAVDGAAHNVEVFLKRGADPNLRLIYDNLLVALSASCGRAEVVRLLLDAGADVNAASPSTGFDPLLIAAKDGHLELTRLLVERGADLEARIRSGATPLMMAALHGHVEVIQFLLEKGARVNAAASKGGTALIFAATRGHVGAVKTLLAAGADRAARTIKGRTALDVARRSGHREVFTLLKAGREVR